MNPLSRLDSSATVDDVMRAMNNDGAVIIERLVDNETMDVLQHELEPHWQDIPFGDSEFIGFRTQRATRLAAISKTYGELLLHPLITATMDVVLLPMCKRYHLQASNGIRVWPNESEQLLHRDDEIFRGYIPRSSQQLVCVVMWALSDFSAANGATRVVTGSHLLDEDFEPPETDFVQAEMPRGSALMYFGSTFHGAGRNITDNPRTGVLASYSLGWLRQEENQYLAVPPGVAKNLPVALQELIGYAIHPPFLGWVDQKDPRSVIDDTGPGLLQPAESGKGS